jgi:hypothetical protein
MSRGPQSFKQADVTKALKAAEKAGFGVSRCEIDPRTGKIVIIAGTRDAIAETGNLDVNEWDGVK